MNPQRAIHRYTVFVSSSRKLLPERNVVSAIIEEHNRHPYATQHKYRLEPLRYEERTAPSPGAPQQVINKQMGTADKSDIFVCIIWDRIGPGTLEEFKGAYKNYNRSKKNPHIMLYRCTRDWSDIEPSQRSQVEEFFTSHPLFKRRYESIDEFEKYFRRDLLKVAEKYIVPDLPRKEPDRRDKLLAVVKESWVEGDLAARLQKSPPIEIRVVSTEDDIQEQASIFGGGRDLLDIFKRRFCQLVILGDPGSGKTLAMLQLMSAWIDEAQKDPELPIPVRFSAASWMEKQPSISSWLKDKLQKEYNLPKKQAKELVDNDKLLICIDALDEIYGAIGSSTQGGDVAQEWRQRFVEALNAFIRAFPTVHLVLTCRTAAYESLQVKVDLKLSPLRIQPLSREVVVEYLRNSDLTVLRSAYERNPILQQMLQVPFYLQTMATAYRDGAQGASLEVINRPKNAVDHRKQLFDQYIKVCLGAAAGARDDLAADREPQMTAPFFSKSETLRYLGWLGRQLEGEGSDLFIEQMQPRWLDQDNRPNGRAYNKYVLFSGMLLALFISTVVALTCGLAVGYEWYAFEENPSLRLEKGLGKGLLVGVSAGTSSAILIFVGYWLCRSWRFAFMIAAALAVTRGITIALSMTDKGERARGFEDGLEAGLGTFLVSAPILIYVMKRLDFARDLIRPLEVSGYDWGKIIWGFVAGSFILVSLWYPFGFDRGLAFGLLGGAVVAGVAVLSGTPDPAPVKPNQRIIQSLQHGLRMGTWMAIFGALCFGLVYGYAHNPVAGIVNGILGLVFFIVSMFFGGLPVVQHYGLRLAMWRKGVIPLRWVKFLDYASDRHLLRKVGGGYTFWHEELREYFKEFYGRTTGSTAKGRTRM